MWEQPRVGSKNSKSFKRYRVSSLSQRNTKQKHFRGRLSQTYGKRKMNRKRCCTSYSWKTQIVVLPLCQWESRKKCSRLRNSETVQICLVCIVSCCRVVSVDAVRRQFLLGRKDLQLLKAMVQLPHLGGIRFLLRGERKQLDPYYWPILDMTGQAMAKKENITASADDLKIGS